LHILPLAASAFWVTLGCRNFWLTWQNSSRIIARITASLLPPLQWQQLLIPPARRHHAAQTLTFRLLHPNCIPPILLPLPTSLSLSSRRLLIAMVEGGCTLGSLTAQPTVPPPPPLLLLLPPRLFSA
jgi:hypothetical protein